MSKAETDFGFRRVPLADKQALVDDVFHSVARRYDLMNDLMSGGLHRAWKEALVTAVNPPRNKSTFAVLDLAGGTGDVAIRIAEKGGPGTRVTVADINREMLAVGQERVQAAQRRRPRGAKKPPGPRSNSSRPTPRRCRCPTRASMSSPSRSASATCRASRRRWPKPIACSSSAAASSAWSSPRSISRRSTRSTTSIRSTSFPALGRAVTGDAEAYRYLVESIRKFPAAGALCRDDADRGLSPRVVHPPHRRRGGAALRLAALALP